MSDDQHFRDCIRFELCMKKCEIKTEDTATRNRGDPMWLCTKYGFFSVKQQSPIHYHVRARVRRDLENLCDQMRETLVVDDADPSYVVLYREVLTPSNLRLKDAIQEWPNAEYRYRLILSKHAINSLFRLLVDTIDYSNFKDEVVQHPCQKEHFFLYHRVGATLASLQQ